MTDKPEHGKAYPITPEFIESLHPRERVLVWVPSVKIYHKPTNGMWTFAHYEKDEYAKRPKPYWHMEYFSAIMSMRNNQPTHWMPAPGDVAP